MRAIVRRTCRALLFVIAFLTAAEGENVWACRYNVRETGFVDLGVETYRLCFFVGQETPVRDLPRLDQTVREVLMDSRLVHEIVKLDEEPDHPALRYLDSREQSSPREAAVTLFSPRGLVLQTDIDWLSVGEEKTLRSQVDKLIRSPLRTRVVEKLATAYGVVLLIEGIDPRKNDRAAQAARKAVEVIEEEMEFMPKPINHGPVVMTLSQDKLAEEEVLLWSLGLQDEPVTEPYAVVLYGRGRWIGPLLRGAEINEDILINILSIVGADCQCGLDPRIIRGVGLPVAWDEQLQAMVVEDLGFDPENPMVRIEVGQIMRISSLVYPRLRAEARGSSDDSTFDKPGVPYVDDSRTVDGWESESLFFLKNYLYVLGIIAALVVSVGVFLLVKSKRAD
jgi:hypothetical protein